MMSQHRPGSRVDLAEQLGSPPVLAESDLESANPGEETDDGLAHGCAPHDRPRESIDLLRQTSGGTRKHVDPPSASARVLAMATRTAVSVTVRTVRRMTTTTRAAFRPIDAGLIHLGAD